MSRKRVLIVEDEEVIRHVLTSFLAEIGVESVAAGSAEEGLQLLGGTSFGVALVDIVLPGMDGLGFLDEIKRESPDTEVIIMTSHASIDTATRAIRNGAYDYIQKPFEDLDAVWDTVRRGLDKRALLLRNRALLEDLEQRNTELAALVQRRDAQVEAGRAMSGIYELPQLLDFFVGLVSRELGVERASIMLVEENAHELFIAASRGLPAEIVSGTRIRVGEGIAGRVAETGLPLLVTDAENEPQIKSPRADLSNSFISAPIVLSVPIKAQQKILGVINITDRNSKEPFAEADRSYIEGLAGQAAVAIERAKHMEALRHSHETLELRVQERTRDLEAARDAAEVAFQAKNQFFSNVSHELRTPMHAILNFASFGKLKAETADRAKLREYFDRVERSGHRLHDLVNDLLDVSSFEAGEIRLDPIRADLAEITNLAVQNLEEQATQEDIAISVARSGDTTVEVDAQMASRALKRILENAVKYTPAHGTIEVLIEGAGQDVVVSVTDSGPGLDRGELSAMFETFVQSRTMRSGTMGTSLGLAACRHIVEAHGGSIWAERSPEGGVTIRFRIPSRLAFIDPNARRSAA